MHNFFPQTVILWIGRVIRAILLGFLALVVYLSLLADLVRGNHILFTLLFLWLITSYLVLPRVYRALSNLLVPDYFVARTRTGDGILGDPINLVFYGSARDVHRAMQAAGWTRADELDLRSSWKMVVRSVMRKSYPSAPVSSLFLFGRKQDFAYQIEVNNNPHARHHIRFWASPKKFWLPGGKKVDWLAATTYDRRVGLSVMTFQVTHKIGERVDEERDFVVRSLQKARVTQSVVVEKHFLSSFRGKNGGGDKIQTDGALPFVTLKHR